MLAAMVELIVFNHNCVEFPVWLLCACWGGVLFMKLSSASLVILILQL